MQVVVTCRALLITPEKEILLVRRSGTDTKKPGAWDIPGGRAESGETTTDTVLRETQEEIGVHLVSPTLVYGVSNPRPEGSGTWLFFAERSSKDAHIILSEEHDAYKWVPFADLKHYVGYKILLDMQSYITKHKLLELFS